MYTVSSGVLGNLDGPWRTAAKSRRAATKTPTISGASALISARSLSWSNFWGLIWAFNFGQIWEAWLIFLGNVRCGGLKGDLTNYYGRLISAAAAWQREIYVRSRIWNIFSENCIQHDCQSKHFKVETMTLKPLHYTTVNSKFQL